ncbi:MAG: hypothetical protein IJG42_02355 [Muribaculaceae bacterium]|nr:hypothetical protein [Muribaculaceae bacterium]
MDDNLTMLLFESQVAKDQEYQSHKIFTLLDSFIDFYNTVYMLEPDFLTNGVQSGLLNIDKVVCGSLAGTLDSVRVVLKQGRINDAYALLRKYHDGIIAVNYINVYIAENYSLDNFVIDKIQKWVKNNQILPSSKKMLNAIRKHKPLENLEKLFDFDGLYSRIRRLLNGNTHYNKLYYLWLNNNMIYFPNRIKELNNLYACTLHLFIFHFAYMYSLNPHYMMSTDYIDALDLGMQPEEGSEYWVAPYVKDIFEKYIVTKRPDIADYMKNHTMMEL